jgi:hypothetical protein
MKKQAPFLTYKNEYKIHLHNILWVEGHLVNWRHNENKLE